MTLRARLAAIAGALPDGSAVTLPVGELRQWLDDEPAEVAPAAPEPVEVVTWRERLWSAPTDVRIGVGELSEALGHSRSWIYKRTGPKSVDRIPHARLGGELVFRVGEIRHWIRTSEDVVVAGPSESPPGERRLVAS